MKKFGKCIVSAVLCLLILPVSAFGKELIPVGQVIGLELRDNCVTVAGLDERLSIKTKADALAVGDRLESIDGRKISTAEDVRSALERSKGTVRLVICRKGERKTFSLTPEITADGPKLGLYLRQGITGIGTVTYYDPETKSFGSLGHGVNDAKGQLLRFCQGNAYKARVVSLRKGISGVPGQLLGAVESTEPIGTLKKNTARGVFGTSDTGWQGKAMTVAEGDEVKIGKATILSTVNGTEVREYSVEILKIYPKSKTNGRNLLLKVTDRELLQTTGGIVQGMSGSPLVQDGKLIGAVTHVLVNDPTMGYGIFIENMLEAAG